MSRNKDTKGKKPKNQPTGDYPVGWCKPPPNQWEKGFCPNPSGRPKREKTIEVYIFEEFCKEINIITSNGKETVNARKAIAKRYVEKLLKLGDLKHFKDAFRIDEKQNEAISEKLETAENPIHAGHRLLAYLLYPHDEELTPEQLDRYLYPDGKPPF